LLNIYSIVKVLHNCKVMRRKKYKYFFLQTSLKLLGISVSLAGVRNGTLITSNRLTAPFCYFCIPDADLPILTKQTEILKNWRLRGKLARISRLIPLRFILLRFPIMTAIHTMNWARPNSELIP
jgi:hypothetical protein